MPSQDLLQSLFDVERAAEALLSDARKEAAKRIDSAKSKAQSAYDERVEDAARRGAEERAAEEARIKADFDAEISRYRRLLEATRLDEEAFARACDAALAKRG